MSTDWELRQKAAGLILCSLAYKREQMLLAWEEASGTLQKLWLAPVYKGGDRHSLADPQKALLVLIENKLGTLKNCTKQRPDRLETDWESKRKPTRF